MPQVVLGTLRFGVPIGATDVARVRAAMDSRGARVSVPAGDAAAQIAALQRVSDHHERLVGCGLELARCNMLDVHGSRVARFIGSGDPRRGAA